MYYNYFFIPKSVKETSLKEKIAFFFATYYGIGNLPKAPGTFGSLATLPFAFFLAYSGGIQSLLIGASIVYLLGILTSRIILKKTSHDPSFIVIDEIVGQLVTFIPVSCLLEAPFKMSHLWIYLAGFLLFRFFDIVKIYPACYFDKKVLNASGVMLDDVVAGLYAGLVLTALVLTF